MKWSQLSKIQTIREKVGGKESGKFKDTGRWRDLTAYWILGLCNNYGYDQESGALTKRTKLTLGDKIRYLPSLFKFMIPLSLLELVYFKNIWIDHKAQYRWLQVDYRLGVFFSRSSVNLVKINKVWLMTLFQFINVLFVVTEVITFFSPSIWLVFALVFWEGLLGGGAYVNTFYRMSKEIPKYRRYFALCVVPVSDSIGIALAGLFAIPAHNSLCGMPMPIRN